MNFITPRHQIRDKYNDQFTRQFNQIFRIQGHIEKLSNIYDQNIFPTVLQFSLFSEFEIVFPNVSVVENA